MAAMVTTEVASVAVTVIVGVNSEIPVPSDADGAIFIEVVSNAMVADAEVMVTITLV